MILRRWKTIIVAGFSLTIFCLVLLSFVTFINLKPVPQSFHAVLSDNHHLQVLDRHGEPLNTTYQNAWNIHDGVELHEIPEFLKTAFILSEDKRFYAHNGPDWRARLSALRTNVSAMRAVRGASTITEQTVRMIHPRPRKTWSRWLEGFEASNLEARYNKSEIFDFYLNQVPYAANRRGVVQAAHYYFNRDLATLSRKEMLALVVLVRAPSRMDLWKDTKRVEKSIERLTRQLQDQSVIKPDERVTILTEALHLQSPGLSVNAQEFVQYVKNHPLAGAAGWPRLKTTLDVNLQNQVQSMLDVRLAALASKNVNNGAVLAVDHQSGEILTWVVGGKGGADTPGKFIDAVMAPRQPGSALKPLLYSLALEKGWTAATIIEDAPLIESVGNGLHGYQNYSRTFYGPVTLRQALGNSLNIPALKTLQFVGAEDYLDYLGGFGFAGLTNHPDFYGDGIALGNGEVTLFELVRAYAAIANHGIYQPLSGFANGLKDEGPRRLLSPETASLMANILSDSKARELEFGEYSVLNFPVQTAVKTGTSSDYRDSWAVGFNYRYTVGVWLGNLDQRPTDGVTGSTGPALLLRSVFTELTRHQETKPLLLHKKLARHDVCAPQSNAGDCHSYTEWFTPGTTPIAQTSLAPSTKPIQLRRPRNGLHIAYDPRLPAGSQAFEFLIQGVSDDQTVSWNIDGEHVVTEGGSYAWPVKKGLHQVSATIWQKNKKIAKIKPAKFLVK